MKGDTSVLLGVKGLMWVTNSLGGGVDSCEASRGCEVLPRDVEVVRCVLLEGFVQALGPGHPIHDFRVWDCNESKFGGQGEIMGPYVLSGGPLKKRLKN